MRDTDLKQNVDSKRRINYKTDKIKKLDVRLKIFSRQQNDVSASNWLYIFKDLEKEFYQNSSWNVEKKIDE